MSDYLKEEPIEQFPNVLQDISDIKYIADTEKAQYILLENEIRDLENSQYMMDANKESIKRYETEFSIKSVSGETIQFRRERLLNRINLKPPYTRRFIGQKLDEIAGTGNWKAYMNNNGTILTIEISMESKEWYTEFIKTIEEIKPASVAIKTKPYSKGTLEITSSCTSATYSYYITLNGEWEIGCNKPMAKISESELVNRVVNSAGVIEESILNTYNKIEKILVNDDVEIKEFTKRYNLNKGEIEVIYDIEETIGAVTNIKILGPENKVYQESSVYIPVEKGMEFKEIIKFVDRGEKKC